MVKFCRLCLSTIHPNHKKSQEYDLLINLTLRYFGLKLNSIQPSFVCKMCETKILGFHEFEKEIAQCQEMLQNELQVKHNHIQTEGLTNFQVDDYNKRDPLSMGSEFTMSDTSSITSDFLNDLFESDVNSKNTSIPIIDSRKMFTCDICKAELLTKVTLKAHMMRHIPETQVTCDICPNKKVFSNIMGLNRHKMYYHSSDPQKYYRTCDQCNRTFKNQNLLNCHKRYDHTSNKKQLHCSKCNKKFKNPITLKNHINKIHAATKSFYLCQFCHKIFSRKEACMEHETSHSGEKRFKCEWCPKSFRNSSHFSTHRSMYSNHNTISPESMKLFIQLHVVLLQLQQLDQLLVLPLEQHHPLLLMDKLGKCEDLDHHIQPQGVQHHMDDDHNVVLTLAFYYQVLSLICQQDANHQMYTCD
uniref:CSON012585 protein n=1 Tax=Culicoides sonorensis TaxID=179676 RepID=A0A336M5V0_CULSO